MWQLPSENNEGTVVSHIVGVLATVPSLIIDDDQLRLQYHNYLFTTEGNDMANLYRPLSTLIIQLIAYKVEIVSRHRSSTSLESK